MAYYPKRREVTYMKFWRSGWIYVFCFSLVCGSAQQTTPAGANRQITLDVVVTDKSGSPVTGLQQRDFTLLDNKRPQNIASFHAVNGGAATGEPSTEVILIVDEVNVPFTKVAVERIEIEKFLRRNGGALARPVSIALLSDSGFSLGNASTQDGNALIADLNRQNASLRTLGKSQSLSRPMSWNGCLSARWGNSSTTKSNGRDESSLFGLARVGRLSPT